MNLIWKGICAFPYQNQVLELHISDQTQWRLHCLAIEIRIESRRKYMHHNDVNVNRRKLIEKQ